MTAERVPWHRGLQTVFTDLKPIRAARRPMENKLRIREEKGEP